MVIPNEEPKFSDLLTPEERKELHKFEYYVAFSLFPASLISAMLIHRRRKLGKPMGIVGKVATCSVVGIICVGFAVQMAFRRHFHYFMQRDTPAGRYFRFQTYEGRKRSPKPQEPS